jgi:hypothetical protein
LRTPLIALLLAALAAPPAYAADADTTRDGRGASGRSAEDGERTAKPEKREERTGDDLASCKRDADGKRGPERSRYMTQCLRERK